MELLRDGPRDEVAGRAKAALEVVLDGLLVDVSFEADLDGTENIWSSITIINWAQKHKDLMSWCI